MERVKRVYLLLSIKVIILVVTVNSIFQFGYSFIHETVEYTCFLCLLTV